MGSHKPDYRREQTSSFGCGRDVEQAEALAGRFVEPSSLIPYPNRSRQRVRQLLLSQWTKVQAVCEYLMQHGTADRATLAQLVLKDV
jgi:hypothetical protein